MREPHYRIASGIFEDETTETKTWRLFDTEFPAAEPSDRDSLLTQREDRAGRGDAAQCVLAKRDQRHCRLGSNRA
jgi:hypothetical protein